MYSYFKNRNHRTQVNNYFSLEKNHTAVSRGSIDGLKLFRNDLVLFITYCILSNGTGNNNLQSRQIIWN